MFVFVHHSLRSPSVSPDLIILLTINENESVVVLDLLCKSEGEPE